MRETIYARTRQLPTERDSRRASKIASVRWSRSPPFIGGTRFTEANRDKVLPLDLVSGTQRGGLFPLSSLYHGFSLPQGSPLGRRHSWIRACIKRSRARVHARGMHVRVCSCLPSACIRPVLDIRQDLYYIPSNVRTCGGHGYISTDPSNLRAFVPRDVQVTLLCFVPS